MRSKTIFFILIFFSACNFPAEKETAASKKDMDTATVQNNTVDVNEAAMDTSNSIRLPIVKKIKNPQGIYQVFLPLNDKVEQTVAFNSDFTYQLQEKFLKDKKDSIITTKGTWTPSDGFIWLYKDQVVRGRYKWKGDTLQYYSPLLKKNFSMHSVKDAIQNTAWQNKDKQGIIVFGVGNEPFWSIAYNNKDSLSFQQSDWKRPLQLKVDSSFNTSDSTGYIAQSDSAQLRVTIFPHFCSDGMSDYIYRNKIKVYYNHQVFNGCGILYKQ